jgi:hypothetical protein
MQQTTLVMDEHSVDETSYKTQKYDEHDMSTE